MLFVILWTAAQALLVYGKTEGWHHLSWFWVWAPTWGYSVLVLSFFAFFCYVRSREK